MQYRVYSGRGLGGGGRARLDVPRRAPHCRDTSPRALAAGLTIYWTVTATNQISGDHLDGPVWRVGIMPAGFPIDSARLGAEQWGNYSRAAPARLVHRGAASRAGRTISARCGTVFGNVPSDVRLAGAAITLPGSTVFPTTRPTLWGTITPWVRHLRTPIRARRYVDGDLGALWRRDHALHQPHLLPVRRGCRGIASSRPRHATGTPRGYAIRSDANLNYRRSSARPCSRCGSTTTGCRRARHDATGARNRAPRPRSGSRRRRDPLRNHHSTQPTSCARASSRSTRRTSHSTRSIATRCLHDEAALGGLCFDQAGTMYGLSLGDNSALYIVGTTTPDLTLVGRLNVGFGGRRGAGLRPHDPECSTRSMCGRSRVRSCSSSIAARARVASSASSVVASATSFRVWPSTRAAQLYAMDLTTNAVEDRQERSFQRRHRPGWAPGSVAESISATAAA